MRTRSLQIGLGASLLVLSATFAFPLIVSAAPPEIVRIDLGSTVNTNYHIVAPNQTWGTSLTTALFVMPGAATGSTSTAAPSFTGTTYFSGPSAMFGDQGGYGMMLLSFTSSDLGASMQTNLPTNANPNMFGGATGPVNKSRLSMDSAGIATGTSVTITLDMKSNIPQLVAVMAGSYPTVTYDSSAYGGTGQLTIQTHTTSTTTNAGDSMTSILGFMVMANTQLGSTPVRMVCQTDAWVGDMFPLFPGFDSSAAAGSGGAGTQGTITARCGSTVYGQTGLQRSVNTFIPVTSLSGMFGSVTTSDIKAFVGSSAQDASAITTGVTNFGVAGIKASYTYTFASPKDVSFGVSGSVSDAVSSSSSGACFLGAARRR